MRLLNNVLQLPKAGLGGQLKSKVFVPDSHFEMFPDRFRDLYICNYIGF